MKTSFRFGEQGATRRFSILLAALMLAPGVALAGITNTKHNLSSTGSGNKFTATNATSEICAFCHTPHGADTGAPAPLWNRKLDVGNTYTSYASLATSTLDGSTAAVGSVSLACLSCHDGTQAMNTVINAAGSGLYNPAGLTQAGTWTATLTGTFVTVGGANDGKLSGTGGANNNGIAMIGTDLKNDHPVGIQYAGGGYLSSANTTANNGDATGAKVDADFVTPKAKASGSTVQFWVEKNAAAGRQKDDLPLYTRTDANVQAGAAQPFVECASCHDPHTENNTFLRVSNTSSALCLACHVK